MADLPAHGPGAGAIPLTPARVSVSRPGFWLAGVRGFVALGTCVTPPPNPSLAELAEVVGEENVRHLVRTFLREFPVTLRAMGTDDRRNQHRLAHSMKSSAQVVGALDLSQRLAALEQRLADPATPDLTPADINPITGEFETIAGPLRDFVAP